MRTDDICALILAAGKGTRMHSEDPKVLKTILGEPMLAYVYDALEFLGENVLTVVGHGAEAVQERFSGCGGFVLQREQLGTGHALQVAWDAVMGTGASHCLVVNGDTPLIPRASLERFAEAADKDAAVAFLTITPDDPAAFGRVVRADDGSVRAIVEAKDYDPEAHGPPTGEVNAGIYLLDLDAVAPLVGELGCDNASGEFYITDLVALAVERGLCVEAVACGTDTNLMGINSPAELVRAEETLRRRLVDRWLDAGVVVRRPDMVSIGPGVRLAPGVELEGPCELLGQTSAEAGARIAPHVRIRDSHLAEDSEVRAFCHLEGAEVGPGCVVGPYARLRPGAVLEEGAKVGNFVEMKQATLGPGAKASHLTYLGDAHVGADSNIGAGTITCNYDGKHKHHTEIGEGAFIGSNTAIVAPVTVGAGALVAAGSVVTKDVPEDHLAVARSRQKNLPRRDKS